MPDGCIRGDIEGSRDNARGAGGGIRAKVGEEVSEFDLPPPNPSLGPTPESGRVMAAGAVGGDTSGKWIDGLESR